ncbi:MAG: putative Ig domain-containing protein, partial [Vicinamibacterales bacterium]
GWFTNARTKLEFVDGTAWNPIAILERLAETQPSMLPSSIIVPKLQFDEDLPGLLARLHRNFQAVTPRMSLDTLVIDLALVGGQVVSIEIPKAAAAFGLNAVDASATAGATVRGTDGNDLWSATTAISGTFNDKPVELTGSQELIDRISHDILLGSSGNDTIYGGSGRDTIYGGTGLDSLIGGTGDDVISGGAGNDLLDGGSGNDIYLFGRGSSYDVISDAPTSVPTRMEAYSERVQTGTEVVAGGHWSDSGGEGGGEGGAGGGEGASWIDTSYTVPVYGIATHYQPFSTIPAETQGDGGADTLRFGNGIELGDLVFQLQGNDLVVRVLSSPNGATVANIQGATDIVRLQNWANSANAVEKFELYDGRAFDVATALQLAAAQGLTADQGFVIDSIIGSVVGSIRAVALASLLPRTVGEDVATSFTLPADAFGATGGPLALSATLANGAPLPSWLTFNAALRTFSGTPPANQASSVDVRVTALDSRNLASSGVFTLNISPENDAPILAQALSARSMSEDTAISFALPAGTFTDVDSDALSLSARLTNGDPLPAWLTFNLATRTFSGTPPANYNGFFDVRVRAVDPSGAAATGDFRLTVNPVNDAPVLTATLAAQATNEETAISFVLPAGAFTDIDGDALTLSATLTSGAVLPSWLTFNATTRTFLGTPPPNYNGLIDVRVRGADPAGAAAMSDFRLTVTPVNDAPVRAATLPAQDQTKNTAVSFTLPVGSFTDIDGDTLTLSATMSDGSAMPSWLVFNAATRSFSGTPPLNYTGNLNVRVSAADPGGLSTTGLFALTIVNTNAAPTLSAPLAAQSLTEDSAISFALPANAFADIDGDALALTATHVDGSALPSWLSFNAATRTFSGTPPANYNGYIDVRVRAADPLGFSATGDFRLTVNPVNDAPVLATALSAQATNEDTAISFVLPAGAFTDADGDVVTLSATLIGGAVLPPWLTFNATTRTFSGTPPANYNGFVDVRVRAVDQSGASATGDFRLTVNSVNDAPVLEAALSAQATNEDTAISFVLPAGTFTDIDGDALTLSATLTSGGAIPSWLTFNAATRTFSGTPPANYNGFIDVRVRAADPSGAAAASDFRLTVNPVNDAPVLATAPPHVTSATNVAVNVTLPASTFTDVEGDTLTLLATLGDGSALPSWLLFNAATRSFSGTPPVGVDSGYDLRVTAADPSGVTATAGFRLVLTPVNGSAVLTGVTQIGTSGNDLWAAQAGVSSSFSDTPVGMLDTQGLLDNVSNDILLGSWGSDTIKGGSGADYAFGGAGVDAIFGGTGDDILDGGAGNDTLDGGWGNDTYRFGRGSGQDTVLETQPTVTRVEPYTAQRQIGQTWVSDGYWDGWSDGEGGGSSWWVDTSHYVPVYENYTAYSAIANPPNYQGDGTQDRLQFDAGVAASDLRARFEGNDLLIGIATTAGQAFDQTSDRIRLTGWKDTNVRIERFKFSDGTTWDSVSVLSWAARQTTAAEFGTVQLPAAQVGGSVAALLTRLRSDFAAVQLSMSGSSLMLDMVVNATTGDVRRLEIPNAVASFGYANVAGAASSALVRGSGGNDLWAAQAGVSSSFSDTPVGMLDTQGLLDNVSNDILLGSWGSDTIKGGVGVDLVFGGGGNDLLIGGTGDDLLDGGAGNDTLDGEMGNDTYVFGRGAGADVISDIQQGITRVAPYIAQRQIGQTWLSDGYWDGWSDGEGGGSSWWVDTSHYVPVYENY